MDHLKIISTAERKNVARKSTANRPLKQLKACSDAASYKLDNGFIFGKDIKSFKDSNVKCDRNNFIPVNVHNIVCKGNENSILTNCKPVKCTNENVLPLHHNVNGVGSVFEESEKDCDPLEGLFTTTENMICMLRDANRSPIFSTDSNDSIDLTRVGNYPIQYEFPQFEQVFYDSKFSDTVNFCNTDSEKDIEYAPILGQTKDKVKCHDRPRSNKTNTRNCKYKNMRRTKNDTSKSKHRPVCTPEIAENFNGGHCRTNSPIDCDKSSDEEGTRIVVEYTVSLNDTNCDTIWEDAVEPVYFGVDEPSNSHIEVQQTKCTKKKKQKKKATSKLFFGSRPKRKTKSLSEAASASEITCLESCSQEVSTDLPISHNEKDASLDFDKENMSSESNLIGSPNSIDIEQNANSDDVNEDLKEIENTICHTELESDNSTVSNEKDSPKKRRSSSCDKKNKKDINEGVLLHVEASKKTDIMKDGRVLKNKEELLKDIETKIENNLPVQVTEFDIQQSLTEEILKEQLLRLSQRRSSPRRKPLLLKSQQGDLLKFAVSKAASDTKSNLCDKEIFSEIPASSKEMINPDSMTSTPLPIVNSAKGEIVDSNIADLVSLTVNEEGKKITNNKKNRNVTSSPEEKRPFENISQDNLCSNSDTNFNMENESHTNKKANKKSKAYKTKKKVCSKKKKNNSLDCENEKESNLLCSVDEIQSVDNPSEFKVQDILSEFPNESEDIVSNELVVPPFIIKNKNVICLKSNASTEINKSNNYTTDKPEEDTKPAPILQTISGLEHEESDPVLSNSINKNKTENTSEDFDKKIDSSLRVTCDKEFVPDDTVPADMNIVDMDSSITINGSPKRVINETLLVSSEASIPFIDDETASAANLKPNVVNGSFINILKPLSPSSNDAMQNKLLHGYSLLSRQPEISSALNSLRHSLESLSAQKAPVIPVVPHLKSPCFENNNAPVYTTEYAMAQNSSMTTIIPSPEVCYSQPVLNYPSIVPFSNTDKCNVLDDTFKNSSLAKSAQDNEENTKKLPSPHIEAKVSPNKVMKHIPLSIVQRDPRLRKRGKICCIILNEDESSLNEKANNSVNDNFESKINTSHTYITSTNNEKQIKESNTRNNLEHIEDNTDTNINVINKKKVKKEIDQELLYRTPLSDLHDVPDRSSYSRSIPRSSSSKSQSKRAAEVSRKSGADISPRNSEQHHEPYKECHFNSNKLNYYSGRNGYSDRTSSTDRRQEKYPQDAVEIQNDDYAERRSSLNQNDDYAERRSSLNHTSEYYRSDFRYQEVYSNGHARSDSEDCRFSYKDRPNYNGWDYGHQKLSGAFPDDAYERETRENQRHLMDDAVKSDSVPYSRRELWKSPHLRDSEGSSSPYVDELFERRYTSRSYRKDEVVDKIVRRPDRRDLDRESRYRWERERRRRSRSPRRDSDRKRVRSSR